MRYRAIRWTEVLVKLGEGPVEGGRQKAEARNQKSEGKRTAYRAIRWHCGALLGTHRVRRHMRVAGRPWALSGTRMHAQGELQPRSCVRAPLALLLKSSFSTNDLGPLSHWPVGPVTPSFNVRPVKN